MGTIGDAPGAARFLGLGADMRRVLECGRFNRSGGVCFEWIGCSRCLILLGLFGSCDVLRGVVALIVVDFT